MARKSTAAETEFCREKIEFAPGDYVWIDGNGKITAGNGTLKKPRPNAFSLVEVADCPMRTPICERACYVHGLRKHAPATHKLYQHNSKTVREILEGPVDWNPCPRNGEAPSRAVMLADAMGKWIETNCRGHEFRWHVSGDVFSEEYARFIHLVVVKSPSVRHWIYTRSYQFIPHLQARNLTVNFSADAHNYWLAERARKEYGVRICYLTSARDVRGAVPRNLPPDSVIFPDYDLREDREWFKSLPRSHRKMVCPVDFYGKKERRRCGPCDRCIKPTTIKGSENGKA